MIKRFIVWYMRQRWKLTHSAIVKHKNHVVRLYTNECYYKGRNRIKEDKK